jgi:hypothetical protein
MKRFSWLFLPLLFACQLQRQPTLEELAGHWQVYDADGYPTVIIEFTNEGTFSAQQNKDRTTTLWGAFEYQEGVLKIINEGGKYSDRCRDTGAYSLFLSDDLLEFVAINDDCPSRKRSTASPWQRVIQ